MSRKGECTDINECKRLRETPICQGNVHCTNTIGSFVCGCLNGYKTIENGCTDIDECISSDICPDNSVCKNTAGNYTCDCDAGYQGNLCTDIDECAASDSCGANSVCSNSYGSYDCSCQPGFEGDGQTCQCKLGFEGDQCASDIDECESSLHECNENAKCSNNYGSYVCSCNPGYRGDGETCEIGECDDRLCPTSQKCVSSTSNECECNEGLKLDDVSDLCEDIDECLQDHDCDKNATCTNSEGSYTCLCNSGYFGDGRTCEKGECRDNRCPLNKECISPRLYCQCKSGFESNENQACIDIDECSTDKNDCDVNADCLNNDGSYECYCRQNYYGNGKGCLPGRCSDTNCPANEKKKCKSSTMLDCECVEGFYLNNSSDCVDKDECQDNDCDAQATCTNNVGSYDCTCKKGYTGNGTTCDLNECETGSHDCHEFANCKNTIGSHSCTCRDGFPGNGISCSARWILVVQFSNKFIIDGDGQSKETSSQKSLGASCSIVWRGRMVMFGLKKIGNTYNQIAMFDQCSIKIIGTLEFKVNKGDCAQRDDAEVFICFPDVKDSDTYKTCYRAVDPLETFTKLPSSTYGHSGTRVALNSGKLISVIFGPGIVVCFSFTISDYLMAVGGVSEVYRSETKTELLSRSNTWSEESDYPFGAEL